MTLEKRSEQLMVINETKQYNKDSADVLIGKVRSPSSPCLRTKGGLGARQARHRCVPLPPSTTRMQSLGSLREVWDAYPGPWEGWSQNSNPCAQAWKAENKSCFLGSSSREEASPVCSPSLLEPGWGFFINASSLLALVKVSGSGLVCFSLNPLFAWSAYF